MMTLKECFKQCGPQVSFHLQYEDMTGLPGRPGQTSPVPGLQLGLWANASNGTFFSFLKAEGRDKEALQTIWIITRLVHKYLYPGSVKVHMMLYYPVKAFCGEGGCGFWKS